MTRRLSNVSLKLAVLHLVSSFLALASESSTARTLLVQEPEEHYYLVKNKPAHIICQAKNAADIIFTCMGTQIPETSVELEDVSENDPGLIQAKIEVTRADVQNHEGDFWCSCSAVDADGQVTATSKNGHVYISRLNTKFIVQPKNTTATVGENVELVCGAPDGQPKPKITWKHNNKKLDTENNPQKIVTDMGSLVIKSATREDSGSYQCMVRNIAGRRESETAHLVIMAVEESSEPGVMLSVDEASKNTEVVKPRTTRQSIKTYFIVEPQETSYITEDKPLLLDCAVVAADILTFSCNGKRVAREQQTVNQGLDAAGNRNIQSQLKVNYTEVEAFQRESGDSQTYQCICNAWFQDSGNPSGWGRMDSHSGFGYIVLAYFDSVFLNDPSDVTTSVGTDATLTCEPPKGQPNPIVYWYKDGTRLDTRSRYISDSKGHLVIHDVQSENAGLYNCVAQNLVKSVQSRVARLTVTTAAPVTTTAAPSKEDYVPEFPEDIPSTPVFVHDLQPEYTLEKGETKTIGCAVMSAEQLTMDCGGKRLGVEDYDLQSKIHRESGKRLLYAKTVVSAEKVAEHPEHFYCHCTAWHLNELKAWVKVISSRGYIKLTTSTAYLGDQFVTFPKDTDAYLESDTKLDCRPPEGHPTPSVHWLKDGVRIDTYADSNFVILDDGTLVIEFVRSTDDGLYVCVADNEAGTMFSPGARLTVIYKHEPTTTEKVAPEITSPIIETTTTADSTLSLPTPFFIFEPSPKNYIIKDLPVNLTCAVMATSAHFVCNGELMTEGTSTVLPGSHPKPNWSMQETYLTITKEKVEAHTGSEPYTCTCRAYYQKEAGEPHLEYIESASAVIQIAYLKNRFMQEPSDIKVSYLGRAELICKPPSGNPEPEIYWLKNGFRLLQNERIQVEDNGSLIINLFNTEDEGGYTCVAENLVRSRTSQTVAVTLAHEIVTEPNFEYTPNTVEQELEKSTEKTVDTSYKSSPYIYQDLQPSYQLIENKPVTLSCVLVEVEFVTITCGMQKVEDLVIMEWMEASFLPNTQMQLLRHIKASINVSNSDLDNDQPENSYYCQCHGHFLVSGEEDYRIIDSSKGYVLAEKNEVSECAEMWRDCDYQLPHEAPDTEFCVAVPEYSTCIDKLYRKCAKVMDTIDGALQANKDAETRCSLEARCPDLESCQNPSVSDLTIQNLCLDSSSRIHCVDKSLADCNVTLSPLEQEKKDNLIHVVDWYTLYCHTFFQVSQSLELCDKIMACDKYVHQLATEVPANWCRFLRPLWKCTMDAVNSCKLDELRYSLQDLYSQSTLIACSHDYVEEENYDTTDTTPESEIEGVPEKEGVDSMGETESVNMAGNDKENGNNNDGDDDKSDDDKGDDDKGDGTNDKMGKGAAASKDNSGNGSSLLHTSILLVTILQLLMMVNMSLR